MSERLEKAIAELTEALEESEELKNYFAAKKNYESDGELCTLINEYNIQASLLETEGRKPEAEKDMQLIESISLRLKSVYDDLEKNPHLAEMRAAEDALSAVINKLNGAVRHTVDPDYDEHCTHDCSTCGGCH
ncbi:MAG: YlbF family regulator [Clostridia bacterium]|nr:YlbF family regulator [Clostridia bacterium]